MPDDVANFKKWEVVERYEPLTEDEEAWNARPVVTIAAYTRRRFEAQYVTYEFPWFGMNTRQMREKGIRALTAAAMAYLEPTDIINE